MSVNVCINNTVCLVTKVTQLNGEGILSSVHVFITLLQKQLQNKCHCYRESSRPGSRWLGKILSASSCRKEGKEEKKEKGEQRMKCFIIAVTEIT